MNLRSKLREALHNFGITYNVLLKEERQKDITEATDRILAIVRESVLESLPKIANDLDTVRMKNRNLERRMQDIVLAESSGYIKAIDQATASIEKVLGNEVIR